MMRSRALLLLLAVAAGQLVFSRTSSVTLEPDMGLYRLDTCAVAFYGRSYDAIRVLKNDSTIKLCFNGTEQECLVVENSPAQNNVTVQVISGVSGFPVDPVLPNFNTTELNCSVVFSISNYTTDAFKLTLFNFGNQLALKTDAADFPEANYNVTAMIGNFARDSWNFGANQSLVDLSGCRFEESILLPGQERRVACTAGRCSATADLSLRNICPDFVCAVTGSSIITVFGNVTEIGDRCTYNLMGSDSGSFSVSGDFKERRRRDLPFLDSLTLKLKAGAVLKLLQGGRVELDGSDVMLSSSARLVGGLELSKDRTGVKARIPSDDITVSFDGYTALLSGPDQALSGMCGDPINPQPVSLDRIPSGGSSCQTRYSDDTDESVNCTRASERCELMLQAPFTGCHDRTDPAPYVEACKNTLCSYPKGDGLNCQFFKAYAQACSIRETPVMDWRSAVGCSDVPETFCQNRYCSEHEFCGEIPGSHRCLCRAVFASKYRGNDTLGEPTLCRSTSATLSLANCLMEEKAIDFTTLHLNDRNCTGRMDPKSHMVTFRFDEDNTCGAEVTMNNSQVIYKNTIMSSNTSGQLIIRQDEVVIDFSCYYPKPELKTVAFRIKDSSVIQQIVSGVWNYTLIMQAFADPRLQNRILPSTEIQLNQKIWVELRTNGLDRNLVAVVTDSCWATSEPEATSRPKYDLIINRCANPADNTVNVMGNGLATFNSFSFNMFQFSGKTSDVFLHCKLELCLKGKRSCATNCGGGGSRRRRSLNPENSALITMSWSN